MQERNSNQHGNMLEATKRLLALSYHKCMHFVNPAIRYSCVFFSQQHIHFQNGKKSPYHGDKRTTCRDFQGPKTYDGYESSPSQTICQDCHQNDNCFHRDICKPITLVGFGKLHFAINGGISYIIVHFMNSWRLR